MRRPVFFAGISFVLGEIFIFIMTSEKIIAEKWISVIVLLLGITMTFLMCSGKKKVFTLLSLCFLLGVGSGFWGAENGRYVENGREDEVGMSEGVENPGVRNPGEGRTFHGKKWIVGTVESISSDRKSMVVKLRGIGIRQVRFQVYAKNGVWQENMYPGYQVQMSGPWKVFSHPTNPGEFDQKLYYRSKGIYASMTVEDCRILKAGKNRLVCGLEQARIRMEQVLDRHLPAIEAGILKAMLLGDKKQMDADVKKRFQESGIAHILAISGLHVALLGNILDLLLRKLKWKVKGSYQLPRSIWKFLLLSLYVILTGSSEATLRAVFMLLLADYGTLRRRSADLPTSMMLALVILLLTRPERIFSSGMQMSFAAVAGVISADAMYTAIYGKERFLTVPLKFRKYWKKGIQGLLLSLFIHLYMTPMLIQSYYELPTYSMLLNLITIPLLTLAVGCGFVGILAGLLLGNGNLGIFVHLVDIIFYPCRFILRFYDDLCRINLKMPCSTLVTGHCAVWGIFVYYAVLIALTVFLTEKYRKTSHGYKSLPWHRLRHEKRGKTDPTMWMEFLEADENLSRRRAIRGNEKQMGEYVRMLKTVGLYSSIGILFISGIMLGNRCSSHVDFLDVGQGNCGILHTQGNLTVMVDGGSTSREGIGRQVIEPVLKYYGIDTIDYAFVSHLDADHMNGISELLEDASLNGIKIRHLVLAKEVQMEDSLIEMLDCADTCGTEVLYVQAKDTLKAETKKSTFLQGSEDNMQGENLRIDILYPDPEETAERSGNEYSLVLWVTYRNLSICYPGDIGQESEKILLEINDSKIIQDAGKSKGKGKQVDEKKYTTILVLPHHGSKYSSSSAFLSWVDPDIVFISCGAHNRYGHPHEETLTRVQKLGCRIFRTDQDGSLCIGSHE